jgi:hypothetical protein
MPRFELPPKQKLKKKKKQGELVRDASQQGLTRKRDLQARERGEEGADRCGPQRQKRKKNPKNVQAAKIEEILVELNVQQEDMRKEVEQEKKEERERSDKHHKELCDGVGRLTTVLERWVDMQLSNSQR